MPPLSLSVIYRGRDMSYRIGEYKFVVSRTLDNNRPRSESTDMQEKMKARLRESRLLAPSGRWGHVHTT